MLVVLVGLIALLSWPEKLDIIDILINYIFRLDIQILIFFASYTSTASNDPKLVFRMASVAFTTI